MADNQKSRGVVKFAVWGALAAALIAYVVYANASGKINAMYYYKSSLDGYAVRVREFKDASKEKPAVLAISPKAQEIKGLMAVPVKKGELLPAGASGVVSDQVIKEGKRAKVEGDKLIISVPWQIKETKGFKYRDTFIHKGVKTDPWSGVWNVVMVIGLGLCLGFMAEGFTDMLGWKIKKIEHFGH
jgi:hypothetical protein